MSIIMRKSSAAQSFPCNLWNLKFALTVSHAVAHFSGTNRESSVVVVGSDDSRGKLFS